LKLLSEKAGKNSEPLRKMWRTPVMLPLTKRPERAICHLIVAVGLSSTLQLSIAERVCANWVSAGSSKNRKAQGNSPAEEGATKKFE